MVDQSASAAAKAQGILMTQPKDDWDKPRREGNHLSDEEIALIRGAYDLNRKPCDIARELKCSSRIAYKYFEIFRGGMFRPRKPKVKLSKPKVVLPAAPPMPAPRFYKSNFEL